MRLALALLLASTFALALPAQQPAAQQQTTIQMQCHDLASSGNYIGPDETVVNGRACRQVTYALVQPSFALVSAPVGDPKSAPVVPSAAQPSPAAVATPAVVSNAPKQCLIVTSAEGHRFRNAMVAGVLTGGIGLAAGATFSGGRYEYRDSYNLSPSEVRVKYKGPELQHLQQRGVHIVVVNKKDKSGNEIGSARTACQQ